jgi:hypothetical protein
MICRIKKNHDFQDKKDFNEKDTDKAIMHLW